MQRTRRLIASPVAQLLTAGLVLLLALLVVTSILGGRAARTEAVDDARALTGVLAGSVAEPAMPAGLVDGDRAALDAYDDVVQDRLVVDDVRRVKIWREDGTIIYSDEPRLVGARYDLDEEELDVLREGGLAAEVSGVDEPENRYERDLGGLVEVYTRIDSPEGQALLFEAYFSAADIERRRAEVIAPFRQITIGALVVVVLIAAPMVLILARRVRRAADERERLLRRAADASDAERRRIARDLHDGVVQDLAGTSFAVSALARAAPEGQRPELQRAADSLRKGLRTLRSLLVEIHPPEVTAATLAAALDDLTAGAAAQGVEARLAVDADAAAMDDGAATLVWRVAQEAVRNALRHAGCRHVEVRVQQDGDRVVLTVCDDGHGFDVERVPPNHYGLRGLRSLAADHGGRLEVSSAPGEVTEVRLEVPT